MQSNPRTEKNSSPACAWTRARLFDYLDGELRYEERQTLEAHLETCAACRQEIAQSYRAEEALASALQSVPAAGEMRAAFYARLAASQSTSRHPWAFWRLAAPVALTAVLLAVVWPSLYQPSRAPRAVPEPEYVKRAPEGNSQNRSGLVRAVPTEALDTAKPPLSVTKNEVKVARAAVPQKRRAPVLLVSARIAPTRLLRGRPVLLALKASAPSEMDAERETLLSYRAEALSDAAEKNASRFGRYAYQPLKDSYKLGAGISTPIEETDEINLRVEDDVRGFTSSARLASAVREHEGEHIVTIEAEDDTAEAEDASRP